MTTLMAASRQWAMRPSDERFTSLPEMAEMMRKIRNRSTGKVISSRNLKVEPVGDPEHKSIQILGPNGRPALATHWSFGQLAERAKAPAAYLRSLPAPIVADAMNWGLRFNRDAADVGLLLTQDEFTSDFNMVGTQEPVGALTLRAATGPNYGRVWNSEIVDALIAKFGDGITGDFRVPGEFGKAIDVTKENTTLYASDRDMFVFLADEKNRIQVDNRRDGKTGSLARGFFLWNSEVGSSSIGGAFFMFDYACSNRMVWGAQGFKEIRLRHTSSAPNRWLEEIAPVLVEYSNSAAAPVEAQIRAAQNKRIDDVGEFLKKRYSLKMTDQVMQAHVREEGRPIETIWDAVTGVTAHAKTITHQNERVNIERDAGKILDLVAA